MESIKRNGLKTLMLCLALVWCYHWSMVKAVIADETGQVNTEQFINVVIKDKFKEGILTDQGRFRIETATKIYYKEGREISYDLLPAPCEAKIFFEPIVNSDQTAVKIIITDTLPGAIRSFERSKPQ